MIAPLQVQPLPFPGSPFDDESGNGFLLRMAERNGLRLREFFTMLGRDPRRQLRPEDAPILARLFDCRTTDILPLFVRAGYGQYWVRHFDLYGRCISRFYLLDLKHPKVCPCCLAEFGYARAVWDLSLFVWCPIHQSALIDRCRISNVARCLSRLNHCRMRELRHGFRDWETIGKQVVRRSKFSVINGKWMDVGRPTHQNLTQLGKRNRCMLGWIEITPAFHTKGMPCTWKRLLIK